MAGNPNNPFGKGGPRGIGGAPGRTPLSQPPNKGPITNPNASYLRSNIGQLGGPTPILDITQFPGGFITIPGTTPDTNDILVVSRPSGNQLRRMLSIRNSASSPSGTNLYLAFGTGAADATALFALPPGGALLFDVICPQDDVHIAGSASGVLYVVGYVNWPLPVQG